MKKLLLLFIIPFLSFGQVVEDFNKSSTNIELGLKITELENDLNYLRHQLDRHHNVYSMGFGLQLLGGLFMVTSQEPANAQIGGVLALLGGVVMISSDRFFSLRHTDRANKKKRNSRVNSSDDFTPLIKKIQNK